MNHKQPEAKQAYQVQCEGIADADRYVAQAFAAVGDSRTTDNAQLFAQLAQASAQIAQATALERIADTLEGDALTPHLRDASVTLDDLPPGTIFVTDEGKIIHGLIEQIERLLSLLEVDAEEREPGADTWHAVLDAKRAVDHAQSYAVRPLQGP